MLAILEQAGDSDKPPVPFKLNQGMLYHINRTDGRLTLVVPKALIGNIFKTTHDERLHISFHRAYNTIRQNYHIRGLAKHLNAYIS